MDQNQPQDLHTMPTEEQLAAMGLPSEREAEQGRSGATGENADLPDLSTEEQLTAMGLGSQPEAGLATEATGPEADLPDVPPDQQLEAMGLTPEPDAEITAGATGFMEPEQEAYEAERAKQEAAPTPAGRDGRNDADGCC